MMDINFQAETETQVRDRLSKGYRARRNFLVAELLGMIIFSTPVKDGYARGGWNVTTGAAPPPSNEPKESRPADKDGSETLVKAVVGLRGVGAFRDVILYNDVPYIDDLERGSSTQAPEGMVRVNLAAFKMQYGDVL